MRKNRVKKSGYIYILENKDKSLLKFGASKNPTERVRNLNKFYKGNKFNIISTFMSDDIFNDECKIKWVLWKYGVISEIFSHPDITIESLIKIASDICEGSR